MSLSDLFAQMEGHDDELKKEASELQKQAAEEDAAGRIMARGFMDELTKLGGLPGFVPAGPMIPKQPGGKAVKAPAHQTSGKAAPAAAASLGKKPTFVPPQSAVPTQSKTKGYKAPPVGKPGLGTGAAKVGPGVGKNRVAR